MRRAVARLLRPAVGQSSGQRVGPSFASAEQRWLEIGRADRDGGPEASTTPATGSVWWPTARHISGAAHTQLPDPAGVAPAAAPAASAAASPLSSLDMEQLMKVLLQPMPLGRVRNNAFGDAVVQLEGAYFFNPAKTLSSMMRALHVIQQVLKEDGHVYILNSNPAMKPLLREVSYLSLNSNVWFWHDEWAPGALSDPKNDAVLFHPKKHQPSRQLFAARGITLHNPHCPRPPVLTRPTPSLDAVDKRWLLAKLKQRLDRAAPGSDVVIRKKRAFREALEYVVRHETDAARLPLPNAAVPPQRAAQVALLVVLDLTHGHEAVQEASQRNIMTVSLLNPHSDLSGITYPVYASEFHPGFQHFFLDWILRVINMPAAQAAGQHAL